MKLTDNDLFRLACAFWMLGIACIVVGLPKFAWIPVAWGGFYFGARHERRAALEQSKEK